MLKYLIGMITFLFLLPLSYCRADDLNSLKYEQAGKVAAQAAFKQSGLEAQFLNVQHVAETNVSKWFKLRHLGFIVTAVSTVAPVIVNKRIQVHSGDFSFTGTSDKKELDFILGF
jgi:hypothetical protein